MCAFVSIITFQAKRGLIALKIIVPFAHVLGYTSHREGGLPASLCPSPLAFHCAAQEHQ